MHLKRHKEELCRFSAALLGERRVPAFYALHLTKRERNVLRAAEKIAEEARRKMAAVMHPDVNLWDTEFAHVEHCAAELANMEWMELDDCQEGKEE
tara:strand:- start:393 stop:680 length:288 start_codon:yes stop_codon:yes gene_type:complete